jgi:hypothetical protein
LLLPSKLFPPHHFHNHKPCYSPPVYRNRTSSPPQSCPIHTPANNHMPRKTTSVASLFTQNRRSQPEKTEDFRIGPLYALISVVNIRFTLLTLSACHSLRNTAHVYYMLYNQPGQVDETEGLEMEGLERQFEPSLGNLRIQSASCSFIIELYDKRGCPSSVPPRQAEIV